MINSSVMLCCVVFVLVVVYFICSTACMGIMQLIHALLLHKKILFSLNVIVSLEPYLNVH